MGGKWGAGRVSFAGKSEVSNKEKIMKDAFKTAARSIREESGQASGQVL